MPPEARGVDFLLVAGVDQTQLAQQLAQIRSQLDTALAAPPALAQGLDRATGAAAGVARTLNEVTRSQGQVTAAVDATRRAQERLGVETVALSRRSTQEQAALQRSVDRGIAARNAGHRQMLAGEQALLNAEERRRTQEAGAYRQRDQQIARQTAALAAQDRQRDQAHARQLTQLRELDRFLGRLDNRAGGRPDTAQVRGIEAVRTGLAGGGPALSAVSLAGVRSGMDSVNLAVARASGTIATHGGFLDGLTARLTRVTQWTGAVAIAYGGLAVAMRGVTTLAEVDKALALMSATMDDQTDKVAALKLGHELISTAMTTMGLSAQAAGGLVFELGKALDNNAELVRGAFLPALALLSLGEADQAETIRTLVGSYNLYGDTLTGAITPAEKFTKISDMLLTAANLSTGSVAGLAQALQFAGAQGKTANVPFAKTLALLTVLQDSMQRAGISGSGLGRVFEALTSHAREVADAFQIPLDFDAPIDSMELLVKVSEKLQQSGKMTVAQFEVLEKAFPREQAQRAALLLSEGMSMLEPRFRKIEAAAGATTHVIVELGKEAGRAASALGNTLALEIDRLLSLITGGAEGKWENFSVFFKGIQGAAKMTADAIAILIIEFKQLLLLPRLAASVLAATSMGNFADVPKYWDQFSKELAENDKKLADRAQSFLKNSGIPGIGPVATTPPPTGVLARPPMPPAGPGIPRKNYDALMSSWSTELRQEGIRDNSTLPLEERLAAALQDQVRSRGELGTLTTDIRAGKLKEPDAKAAYRAKFKDVQDGEERIAKLRSDILQRDIDLDRHYERTRLERGSASFQNQRDLDKKLSDLRKSDAERFEDSVWADTALQLGQNTDVARNNQQLAAMNEQTWQIHNERLHNFRVKQLQDGLGVLGQWNEAVEVMLGGATRAVEQEYNAQRGVVESHFAVLLADETLSTDERAAIQQRYLDARARMDADYFGRQEAAAIADAQATGRREAEKTGYILSEIDKRRIAEESAAQVEIRRAEDLIRVRAGLAVKTAAYLKDPGNMALEETAAAIAADQQLLERKLRNREVLDTAVQRSTDLHLALAEQEAQAGGHVADFLILSFKRAADAAGDFWSGLQALANEAARSMSQTLSDVFFDRFNDQLKSAADYFESFITSMKRAISDFLATQAVQAFGSLLLGVAGAAFGTGMGGGGSTNVFGSALGGTTNGGTTGQAGGGGFDVTGTAVNLGTSVITEYAAQLLGTSGTATAAGSAGGIGVGLRNLGANYAGGGIQGAAFGLSATQAQAAAYTSGYNLALSQGAGSAAAEIYAAEAAYGIVGGSSTGAAPTAGLGGAGGAASAATTIAAAVAAAYQVYSFATAVDEERYGAAAGNVAGSIVGAAVGAYVAGPAGILVGAVLGSVAGEFIGGLFDETGPTHEMREAEEANETLQGALTFQNRIVNASDFSALAEVLLDQQGANLGGRTPSDRADHANPTVEIGIRRGVGVEMISRAGGIFSPTDNFTGMEFIEEARQRPQDVYARIRAGVDPSMTEPADRQLERTIVEQIRQLIEQEANETLQGAQTFQDRIVNARDFSALAEILLDQQGANLGGRTPSDRTDHANPTVEIGIRRGVGAEMISRAGGVFSPPDNFTGMEFIEEARRRPQDVYARIRAGVDPSLTEPADRQLERTIIEQIRRLDEIQARVNMALVELFRDSTAPATTFNEAILEDAERFRRTIVEVNTRIQTELERAWIALSVMRDPDAIIAQTERVRGLIEARYNTEIELIRAYASELENIFGIWKQLSAAAGEQIAQLQISGLGPPDPRAQMDLARSRFDVAQTAFQTTPTPASAERMRSLVDDVLQTSSQVFDRPSREYQAIFASMVAALREVEVEATEQQETVQGTLDVLLGEGNTIAGLTEGNTRLIAGLVAELRLDFSHLVGLGGFGPGGPMSATLQQILGNPPAPRVPLPPQISESEMLAGSLVNNVTATMSLTGAVRGLDNTMSGFAGPGRSASPPYQEPYQDFTGGGGSTGSYQHGTDYVPTTGPAILHQGEMIVPAGPAAAFRQYGGSRDVSLTFGAINITSTPGQDARQIARAVRDEILEDVRRGELGFAIRERVRHGG